MTDVPALPLDIKPGEHLCAVFDGDAERDRILGEYLRHGITVGDKCVFGAHDADAARLLGRLDPAGGLAAARSSGQLEVLTGQDPVVTPEQFSFARILDLWATITARALQDGYRRVRLGAEARWWAPQTPDNQTFLRYESELNRFTPGTPQAILCMYDVRHADGAFIMNAIRVHPRVVLYGLTFENPFYTRPDDFESVLGWAVRAASARAVKVTSAGVAPLGASSTVRIRHGGAGRRPVPGANVAFRRRARSVEERR